MDYLIGVYLHEVGHRIHDHEKFNKLEFPKEILSPIGILTLIAVFVSGNIFFGAFMGFMSLLFIALQVWYINRRNLITNHTAEIEADSYAAYRGYGKQLASFLSRPEFPQDLATFDHPSHRERIKHIEEIEADFEELKALASRNVEIKF